MMEVGTFLILSYKKGRIVMNILGVTGQVDIDVFFMSYVFLIGSILAGATWGVCNLYAMFPEMRRDVKVWLRKRAIRRANEKARESQRFYGAEATLPRSLRIQIQTGFTEQDASLGEQLWPCPKGGAVEVVENCFRDLQCQHPCSDRTGCSLAS